jgi:hypothetical protein
MEEPFISSYNFVSNDLSGDLSLSAQDFLEEISNSDNEEF